MDGRTERGRGSCSSLCVFMGLRPDLQRTGHTTVATSSFADNPEFIALGQRDSSDWWHIFFLYVFLLHITILPKPASIHLGVF